MFFTTNNIQLKSLLVFAVTLTIKKIDKTFILNTLGDFCLHIKMIAREIESASLSASSGRPPL